MNYYTRQQNKKRSEATEQEALIAWCGWMVNQHPELKLIYHVPNGGSRNTLEAANLKRQGVKAGVPDLCLPVPKNGFHGLYIEMKYGKNKTTEAQKEWLDALTEQGYFTVVCYGAEEAERVLSRYLGFPGYPKIGCRAAVEMVMVGVDAVPEELCTIDREGGADDFTGCGQCMESENCASCVVRRVFEEYAKLTGQYGGCRSRKEYEAPETTVEQLIGILQGLDPKAIVIGDREKNIRVYPGKENKKGGRNIVLLC